VDKTSMGTKRPWGQNVRSDKMSVRQNVRGDKRSVGQNVRRTKRPWGQSVRGQNVRLGQIYQGLARQFSLIKSIEREGKIRQYPHSLSVGQWGRACTVLNNQRSFIVIKTVYIPTM
jgi:hypothetical protein